MNAMNPRFLPIAALGLSVAATSLTAQNLVAPNDGAYRESRSAPMTPAQASSRSYARNIGAMGVDSSAYYRYTTGDDIRGGSGEGGAGDFTSNEYGLRFSGAIGEVTTFSYSPNWRTYSGGRYDDQFGQSFGLNGSVNVGGWQLGLIQTYSDSYYIITETATQTDEETIGTRVTGNYQVNSSLTAGWGASSNTRDSERFNSSDTTTFDAQISQLLPSNASVALILSAGEEDTNEGFNADFAQISGSFNYQPSEYLYISALLGQQERSFNITGAPDLDSAIYSLALNFTPADFTEVSIRADRSVGASLFSNQTRENETFSINLNQRLLDMLNLSLSYGENSASYLAAIAANDETRSDEYEFFDARLSFDIMERGAISIFYRDQSNDSDDAFFGYDGSQHGIEASVAF